MTMSMILLICTAPAIILAYSVISWIYGLIIYRHVMFDDSDVEYNNSKQSIANVNTVLTLIATLSITALIMIVLMYIV